MKFNDIYSSARPYIACFVILRHGSKVAMIQRRKTGWMDGFWGLPAGKVEYGESYAAGVVREAKEEAGVDIRQKDLRFVHVAHRHGESDDKKEFMDWVDVYFEASIWSGEPHNAEPEKGSKLAWIDLQALPENIVPPQKAALERIAKNEYYSEFGWEDSAV